MFSMCAVGIIIQHVLVVYEMCTCVGVGVCSRCGGVCSSCVVLWLCV